MSAPLVEPSACTWCGIARRGHGRQYADAVGWHEWEQPTDEQVLARMKARRLALTVAREGALPVPVGPESQDAETALAGARLSLYEEEQDSARLRLALKSAQRGRRELRELVRQMCAALIGYDCPPPGETPFELVTRVTIAQGEYERIVSEFVAARAEYVTAIRNCHPDNGHDYDRWQGHAAARRQLAEQLGLPVAWPPEDDVSVAKSSVRLSRLLAPSRVSAEVADGEHYASVHHEYREGRDLPETGGNR